MNDGIRYTKLTNKMAQDWIIANPDRWAKSMSLKLDTFQDRLPRNEGILLGLSVGVTLYIPLSELLTDQPPSHTE